MLKAGRKITSPNGVYKLQFILSTKTTVYYNDENEYYVYKTNDKWVVSQKSFEFIL